MQKMQGLLICPNVIKRRKRKEVDGLKPVVGIYLYSESEQDAGFGNQEVLIF